MCFFFYVCIVAVLVSAKTSEVVRASSLLSAAHPMICCQIKLLKHLSYCISLWIESTSLTSVVYIAWMSDLKPVSHLFLLSHGRH